VPPNCRGTQLRCVAPPYSSAKLACLPKASQPAPHRLTACRRFSSNRAYSHQPGATDRSAPVVDAVPTCPHAPDRASDEFSGRTAMGSHKHGVSGRNDPGRPSIYESPTSHAAGTLQPRGRRHCGTRALASGRGPACLRPRSPRTSPRCARTVVGVARCRNRVPVAELVDSARGQGAIRVNHDHTAPREAMNNSA